LIGTKPTRERLFRFSKDESVADARKRVFSQVKPQRNDQLAMESICDPENEVKQLIVSAKSEAKN